jgi:phosphatidylserine/phosphatidylglycerophosphate/cardiolipin synthase-like enzyme
MQNAVAFANNDVITVAWSYGQKLDRCLGFAIYRIDSKGKETPLPAMATFPKMKRQRGDTCEKFPIQKFYWKDVYARLIAEKTGERQFRYKVVPVEGTPGKLVPMKIPHVISNQVEITSAIAPGLDAFFNRGLISTQSIARAMAKVKGKKKNDGLMAHISDEKDPIRASLSGDMVEALRDFVLRAKSGGKLYASLYELHDEQLVQLLEQSGKKLNIVLSNAMKQENNPVPAKKGKAKAAAAAKKSSKKVDGNMDARNRLTATAGSTYNRILGGNQIGHNKFVVYVDKANVPRAVLMGSTNWTPTGLCAQTNNTLVIENNALAKRYLSYWNALKDDTKKANGTAKLLQGPKLRTWDHQSDDVTLAPGVSLTSWFSPNTPKLRGKNPATEARPVDMADVAKAISKAEHAVLFLAFYPGTPSVANWAGEAQRTNKDLFVRGCVTNPSASESFYYELRGTQPPKPVKPPPGGKKVKVAKKQDNRVIAAKALTDKTAPPSWIAEMLTIGFAIIHDKVVVVDPFSDKCVVVTGSHNLGHKASFNNDENLVIVRGNQKLAQAYATHVLDVYDHFAWRVMMQDPKFKGKENTLDVNPDIWQSRYFNNDGSIRAAQLKFWLNATT